MEKLTKHQIILLTLLVSFVTSIATGIVTVALMNQAPVGVTQTINRVVERTIQQVTSPSTPNSTPTVKETVVVNEDDQIVSAISKNSNSILRIYQMETDSTTGFIIPTFVAMGAVVTDDGIIATDNDVISPTGIYFVKTDDGNTHDLTVLRSKDNEQIALLQLAAGDKNPITGLSKITLSSQGDLQLGQAVVYIGGETKNIVATGIVSTLNTKNITIAASSTDANATSTATSTQTIVSSVETSVPEANLIEGGLLLNLSGELVGIKSAYSQTGNADLFAPVEDITSTLANFSADSQKTQQ